MAGLAETNGRERGREEFLGIDHTMDHADRFIPDAIHDGQRDADDIGLEAFVEVHVFNEELADPVMEGAVPPGCVFTGSGRQWGQCGDQVALHVGDIQHLGGGPDDLRNQLVGFALGPEKYS